MKVYSLLDRKVRQYGQLIVAANEPTMRRMCVDMIRGSGSLLEKYPEDFDLFEVGEFSEESGVLDGAVPALVGNLRDILGPVVES